MNDSPCARCGHSHYDHGAWLEDREAVVAAQRPLGCRIAHCRCDHWQNPYFYSYE